MTLASDIALPSHYDTGTATVAVGGVAVTGQDTQWLDALAPGDLWGTHRGTPIRIASIESDTALTLAHPWPGFAQTAAPYEVQIVPDPARVQEQSRILLAQLADGLWLEPDAVGTVAERAAYDDEPRGFIYLRVDVTPFQVAVKKSDTSADWSGWTVLRGTDGAPGTNGTNGTGDKFDTLFKCPGRPATGELFETLPARAFTLPSGLAGSIARARGGVATATSVFLVRKNGVAFGTVTFNAGSNVGIFAGTPTAFAYGDWIQIVAPSPRDDTLSDIHITLAGTRV